MKKIKKFKIKSFSKPSGKLLPLSFGRDFPITIKRIFFIYGKKNKIRGNHAHKKCSQFFIPILGKTILYIKTLKINKKIILDYSTRIAVLVPPKYWCTIKFSSKKSIIMVACNKYYNSNDYLTTFDKYKKYLISK